MANGFSHLELSTDNVKAAKKFYKKVFDWKITDLPDMSYTMIDAGKGQVGGGMMPKNMAEQPTAWMPYVTVDSVKKTMAKATKLGANVVVPFQEIGEMGAIGVFVDPTGAAIGVWEAAKKAAKKPAPKKAAKKVAKKATKKSAKN